MARTALDSSVLAAVEYFPDSHTLEVEFVRGALYRYAGVPVALYEELLSAESHGTFYNARIRDRFSFVRLERTGGG